MNPFAPGPASQPPVLVGRDTVTAAVVAQLGRADRRQGSQPVLVVGERGMGKTVLLDRAVAAARSHGWAAGRIESQQDVPLGETVAASLGALYKQIPGRAGRPPDWLQEFDISLGGRLVGAEVQVTRSRPPALPGLFTSVTELLGRAESRHSGVLLAVDELQQAGMVDIRDLGRLAQAANSETQPFVLVAAGLPSVRDRIIAEAPTYASRFDYQEVGRLSAVDTRSALVVPANEQGVLIDPDALERLVSVTDGYPYFVQLYGRHSWDAAIDGRITRDSVNVAHDAVMAALDVGPYGVAWQQLRPTERRFLAAMADTRQDPVPAGDILTRLGQPAKALSAIRQRLIDNHLVEVAGWGKLRFAWPGYGSYIRARHADELRHLLSAPPRTSEQQAQATRAAQERRRAGPSRGR